MTNLCYILVGRNGVKRQLGRAKHLGGWGGGVIKILR